MVLFHVSPLVCVVRQPCEGLSQGTQPADKLRGRMASSRAGLEALPYEVDRKVVPACARVLFVYWTVFCEQRLLT